jgi:hypothetical protein
MFLRGGAKEMKLTAITLTGDRPEAFGFCQQWMHSQTRRPDQWIIVHDGKNPLRQEGTGKYYYRLPQPDDPQHTMILNLQEAVQYITGDAILIFEDDEYYAPRYIEEMAQRLEQYEIVGIGRSKYYHLPTGGYIRHNNLGHASLAQTAFRTSLLPEFSTLIPGDMFLDIRLWKLINGPAAPICNARNYAEMERISENGRGIIFDDGEDYCLYVGMKGLPGRNGIGSGHNEKTYRNIDKDRSMLRRWIPDNYKAYLVKREV